MSFLSLSLTRNKKFLSVSRDALSVGSGKVSSFALLITVTVFPASASSSSSFVLSRFLKNSNRSFSITYNYMQNKKLCKHKRQKETRNEKLEIFSSSLFPFHFCSYECPASAACLFNEPYVGDGHFFINSFTHIING